MTAKINIIPIIRGHLNTLRDSRGTKLSRRDIIVFAVVPLLLGIGVLISGYVLPMAFLQLGIVAVSIVIPLMVNILFSIYGLVERISAETLNESATVKARRRNVLLLIDELHHNLLYITLVAGVSLFIFCVGMISSMPWPVHRVVFSMITIVGAHMGFTILMVLKRIHTLITYDAHNQLSRD